MARTVTLVPDWEEIKKVNAAYPPKFIAVHDHWIGFHDTEPTFNEKTNEWEPRPYVAFNIPAGFSSKVPTLIPVPK